MIQKICVANAEATRHCACSFIRRAVNQTSYARLYQSSCTHRARFNRRVNINACEPVVTELSGSFAKSDYFSVGCGIAVGSCSISGNSYEFVFADDTRADGNFATLPGFSSGVQGLPHPVLIKISAAVSNNERPL